MKLLKDSRKRFFGSSRGVTVFEIVVTMGIMVFIVGWGLIVGFGWYRQIILNSERDNLVGYLRRARSAALDNINQVSHGLYIGGDTYTVFEGTSYAARNSTADQSFPKSSIISVGGPLEFVFGALTGNPAASGAITLSDNVKSLTISINNEGRIDW